MKLEIKKILPTNEEVRELFKLLDSHNMKYCSPEVCHLTQPEDLENINSILLGVFCDGELCGMGGLKYFECYAEVTRMYVSEQFQGNKLGEKLLKELEERAKQESKTTLKLETSDKFEKAVSFYKKNGFYICEPFGEYKEKPYNTYMKKDIGGGR